MTKGVRNTLGAPPSRLIQQTSLSTPLLVLALALAIVNFILPWLTRRTSQVDQSCRVTQVRLAKTLKPSSPTATRVPRESTGRIRKEQWTEVTMTDHRIGYWTVTSEVYAFFGQREAFLVKDTTCSICLADYEHDDIIQCNLSYNKFAPPPCSHVFHKHCVLTWLDTDKRECPCCRSAFVVYQRVEI